MYHIVFYVLENCQQKRNENLGFIAVQVRKSSSNRNIAIYADVKANKKERGELEEKGRAHIVIVVL